MEHTTEHTTTVVIGAGHAGLAASHFLSERAIDQVPDLTRARRLASPQLAGTPDRTTLDINALTAMGVELVGRSAAVRDGELLFSGGLRAVISLADLKMERLLNTAAWSPAPACTRWGCPYCDGASPRSSTASRTTLVR